MTASPNPVALVTGGSAGLGFQIARTLCEAGYEVVITGRTESTLADAANRLSESCSSPVTFQVTNVTDRQQVDVMFAHISNHRGRLDVLVNCVGQSDRGLMEQLRAEDLRELLEQNVISTLNCSQAALEMLSVSRGVIVNIGSLASKVSPRYLGGYCVAKHALAALTGQLRLELQNRGIHVALVSPGPIRRDDSGGRYNQQMDDHLPEQAKQPGGGTRVKGLEPERVARAVLRCIRHRTPDVMLPGYLRVLIAVGHLFPRLGDWLLLKFTSSKD